MNRPKAALVMSALALAGMYGGALTACTDVGDNSSSVEAGGPDSTSGGEFDSSELEATGDPDVAASEVGDEAATATSPDAGTADDAGGGETANPPAAEAGPADAGELQASEAGSVDAGEVAPAEAGPVDAGELSADTGAVDAGEFGTVDAGAVDAGEPGTAEAGAGDAGKTDAGPADAGAASVDAGVADAGSASSCKGGIDNVCPASDTVSCPVGETDGVGGPTCNQTETLLYDYDHTGACLKCLLNASCLHDEEGDNPSTDVYDCDDLTGTTPSTSEAGCLTLLSCELGSNCGEVDVDYCYCGNNIGSVTCEAAGFVLGGACVSQEQSALASTSTPFILSNITTLTPLTAGGVANSLLNCAKNRCDTACF